MGLAADRRVVVVAASGAAAKVAAGATRAAVSPLNDEQTGGESSGVGGSRKTNSFLPEPRGERGDGMLGRAWFAAWPEDAGRP